MTRLQYLRLRAGLTPSQVYNMVGIKRYCYPYIELGRSRPKPEHLEALAVLFNESNPEALLLEAAETPKPTPPPPPVRVITIDNPHLLTLKEFKAVAEREYVLIQLKENRGIQIKTAKAMKTPLSNLTKRLKTYALRPIDGVPR